MIYTVTFNPAVDYAVRAKSFVTGEINRTAGEEIFFGGKGINVSVMLKHLGVESTALGFIAGFTGDAIAEATQGAGIRTDFVRLKNGFSRINVKIESDVETALNGLGPEIDGESLNLLFEKIDRLTDGDAIVLAGSIPKSLPDDIYEILLSRLSGKSVLTVVDATGELLINTLKYKPFLIKPNLEELSSLFGRPLTDGEEIRTCAASLQKMGARNVLVSLGADGALLLDENGGTHARRARKGTTVSTVGAGDSMVAGFLAGWTESEDYDYALRLGVAAGSATAFTSGIAGREAVLDLLGE
ncbi:MAG: 1-phosphofructokinase [Lachnospiraceae bacterium]|nr:1-phosphofructokinase [Lachnospiraceae bacterium]